MSDAREHAEQLLKARRKYEAALKHELDMQKWRDHTDQDWVNWWKAMEKLMERAAEYIKLLEAQS
jgi:hypothetical protein